MTTSANLPPVAHHPVRDTVEHRRLAESRKRVAPWYRWGPYLSDRQWGTVREDCSADGKPWTHFPHDHARSRTYRLSRRLTPILLRGPDGRRPVFGDSETFQTDTHWRDCLLFYEYFHGDTGAGLGAAHQTGWTILVATLLDQTERGVSAS